MASLEEEYDDNNNNVIENERDTFTINNHNNNNARSNTINNKEVPVSRRLLRTFECNRHLEALLSLDRLARKAAHLFDAVIERYDCGQTYSVHFQCEDCKVSRLLPYIYSIFCYISFNYHKMPPKKLFYTLQKTRETRKITV